MNHTDPEQQVFVECLRNKATGEARIALNIPIEMAYQMDLVLERHAEASLHPLQVALRALLKGVGYVS